jgi:AcrR family transcriptional regulator
LLFWRLVRLGKPRNAIVDAPRRQQTQQHNPSQQLTLSWLDPLLNDRVRHVCVHGAVRFSKLNRLDGLFSLYRPDGIVVNAIRLDGIVELENVLSVRSMPAQSVSRKSQSAADTRDRLMRSAIQIMQTKGIERLTLDAVSKEAQVSKGGLLYHFSSKEALVTGVIQYLIDDFEAAIARELAQDQSPESPGKWLRAYVNATFNYQALPTTLISNLMAAATIHPDLLKSVQARWDVWQQKLQPEGIDPVNANLIRLAADGVGMNEMFGIVVSDESMRQQILAMLLVMIQEAESDLSHAK